MLWPLGPQRPCQEHADEAMWGRLYHFDDAPPPIPVMRLLMPGPGPWNTTPPTITELNADITQEIA